MDTVQENEMIGSQGFHILKLTDKYIERGRARERQMTKVFSIKVVPIFTSPLEIVSFKTTL